MSGLSSFDGFFEVDSSGNTFTNQLALSTLGGGKNFLYNMDNEFNHLKAYNNCAPLKAIISKRAKAFNSGVITVVNTNTNKPATGQQKLIDKLRHPNPLQSWSQFFAQQNIYIDLFGWCPVLKTSPVGWDNDITNLWNLPPWIFEYEFTNNWLYQTEITGIFANFKLTITGQNEPIDNKNITLLFDDGFGTDMDINMVVPDSRLRSLEYPIGNIISAYMALNTMITKRGAIGILSNDAKDAVGAIPLPEKEKNSLQDEFRRYGITGQEWQVIISQSALKWQQMGYPVKDLMLLESVQDGIMRICDQYGYPYRLLSSEKSASYNDVKEFGKQLYQDTIIPEGNSRIEQFSKVLFKPDSNLKLTIDFSQVYNLQDDKQGAATARKTLSEALEKEFRNNALTLNEWRAALGSEPISNNGDKYYYELLALGYSFGNTTINGGDNLPTQTQQQSNQAA